MSSEFLTQFIRLSNVEVRRAPQSILSNVCGLYITLRAAVVRGPSSKAGAFNFIYSKLYKNNILAARYSQEKLGEKLGVSKGTISRWIKILEKEKFLTVRSHTVYNKRCYVYILGYVMNNMETGKIEERYFSEDLALHTLIEEKLEKLEGSFLEV